MKLVRFCFPHKTASMFGFQVLKAMSQAYGIPHFSLNNTPPNQKDLIGRIEARADDVILVGPARTYGAKQAVLDVLAPEDEILDVCQIRNPLDIIVSQFFSHGWIHPDRKWSPETIAMRNEIQAGRLSLGDYALLELQGKAQFGGVSLVEKMKLLNHLPKRTTRLIVAYEQFYDDYDGWVRQIVDFLPDSIVSTDLLLQERPDYARAVVLAPGRFFDNPLDYVEEFGIGRGRHIRSAAPGDHLHFLTPEQISSLTEVFLTACPSLRAYYG